MKPMMACGHTANASMKNQDGSETPCCVICVGITRDAITPVTMPNLTGRMMRCSYGDKDKPSDPSAAFFAYRPDKLQDEYYCGCHGWD
jgi:hypothetical protein